MTLVVTQGACRSYAYQPRREVDETTLEVHLQLWNQDSPKPRKTSDDRKKCALCRETSRVSSMKFVASGEFDCPVCHESLPNADAMLFQCGHLTCKDCTVKL